jgi:hypothetical protein
MLQVIAFQLLCKLVQMFVVKRVFEKMKTAFGRVQANT